VTDEPLEMNHIHFLVAPRIEKSRDFSAHVVNGPEKENEKRKK